MPRMGVFFSSLSVERMRPCELTCRRRHMGGTEDTAEKPVATRVTLHRGAACATIREIRKQQKKKSQHPGRADLLNT